jgi:glycoside/pentoside/hexuronide:cation symporter, GPH family
MANPKSVLPPESLSRGQRLAFAFPSLPHALIAYTLYSLLPAVYASSTKVTLAQIGAVAAASRIVDAITDPVVGYLSDKTHTRFGSRKPWVAAAMFFLAAGAFPLFNPPEDATFVYFAIWSTVLYLGFTMFEVPRNAWGSEVTRDYLERSRIAATVGMFNIGGSLTVYMLPIVMSQFTGTSVIGESTMRGISTLYLCIMPIALILSLFLVPKGMDVARKRVNLFAAAKAMVTSRPLIRFYSITVLWGLGQGSFMAVSFIFQTEYLGLAEQYAYVMITYFAASLLFMPIWSKILVKTDRHRVWGLFVALSTSCGLIALLLPRGPEAFIPILFLTVFRGFLGTPQNFLPGAVLSDVIDYDTLKTGSSKAGNIFALQTLLIKISMALGGAVAFYILDVSGFRMGQVSTPSGDLGLITCYVFIPLVLHAMMAGLCWRFPISRSRHAIIQKRLEQRAARLGQAISAN